MESKWMAIMVIGVLSAMFGSFSFSAHTKAQEETAKSQCRASFAQSTRSAEEIQKICGK